MSNETTDKPGNHPNILSDGTIVFGNGEGPLYMIGERRYIGPLEEILAHDRAWQEAYRSDR